MARRICDSGAESSIAGTEGRGAVRDKKTPSGVHWTKGCTPRLGIVGDTTLDF